MKYLDLIDDMAPEWHARALCHPDHGHDPAIWFPDAPNGSDPNRRKKAIAPAVQICNTCPVKRQCLDAANTNRETAGVWAGVDFEGATKGSHDAA